MANILDPLVAFEAEVRRVLPLPPGPATVLSQMPMPEIPGMGQWPQMAALIPSIGSAQSQGAACPYGGT